MQFPKTKITKQLFHLRRFDGLITLVIFTSEIKPLITMIAFKPTVPTMFRHMVRTLINVICRVKDLPQYSNLYFRSSCERMRKVLRSFEKILFYKFHRTTWNYQCEVHVFFAQLFYMPYSLLTRLLFLTQLLFEMAVSFANVSVYKMHIVFMTHANSGGGRPIEQITKYQI